MPEGRLGLDASAIAALVNEPGVRDELERKGMQLRNRARQNAARISPRRTRAIVMTPVAADEGGPYVDVGYDKTNPGWVLYFSEIGTRTMPPRPHLRPAVGQASE